MSRLVALCLFALPAAFGADLYTWQALPDLPEPLGVAGPCAGVSNGALIVAGDSRVFVLEDPSGPWRSAGTLEQPRARGASVTTPDGVICLRGSEAFRLRWINGRIEREQLPELPRPCADMSPAILGNTVYVAGGQALPEAASATKGFWRWISRGLTRDGKSSNPGGVRRESSQPRPPPQFPGTAP